MEVAGRIAVVTGGGEGMGRELVRQVAAAGCHVAALDVSADGLAETVELSTRDGVRLTTHLADVSVEADLQRCAAEIREQHRSEHVNLLFNNAGVGGGGSMLVDTRESWERTFDIDWGGVYLGVRTFLPMLVASEQGKIVNTASVCGFWAAVGPERTLTSYAAAKFAVKGFTEALIGDLRLHAPHVSAAVVMPGHIGTALRESSRLLRGGVAGSYSDDELEVARGRFAAGGFAVERLSDADIAAMVDEVSRQFAEKAPTTPAEAATIILDGVRRDQWRILVGPDAHVLDRMVRADPEDAYTQSFYDSFVEQTGWALGEL